MSIPSYKVEGHGHSKRTTLTFYGKRPPRRFSAMGVEYVAVVRCRMVLTTHDDRAMLRCTKCGRAYVKALAPKVGEHCRCGAEVARWEGTCQA